MQKSKESSVNLKIVSGGQTGVDRAALDAALKYGVECGGWCPEGRLAEDGTIPLFYPVIELKGSGYKERTRQNVVDSDATVIIYFITLSGGTRQTLLFCRKLNKPYLLIDGTEFTTEQTAQQILKFVKGDGIAVLNVAGPRASSEISAYSYTFKAMTCFLRLFNQ